MNNDGSGSLSRVGLPHRLPGLAPLDDRTTGPLNGSVARAALDRVAMLANRDVPSDLRGSRGSSNREYRELYIDCGAYASWPPSE